LAEPEEAFGPHIVLDSGSTSTTSWRLLCDIGEVSVLKFPHLAPARHLCEGLIHKNTHREPDGLLGS
jgi:hypothetical protein